jgi:hypothetical protein
LFGDWAIRRKDLLKVPETKYRADRRVLHLEPAERRRIGARLAGRGPCEDGQTEIAVKKRCELFRGLRIQAPAHELLHLAQSRRQLGPQAITQVEEMVGVDWAAGVLHRGDDGDERQLDFLNDEPQGARHWRCHMAS